MFIATSHLTWYFNGIFCFCFPWSDGHKGPQITSPWIPYVSQSRVESPHNPSRLLQVSASRLCDAEYSWTCLTHCGQCSLADDVILYIHNNITFIAIMVSCHLHNCHTLVFSHTVFAEDFRVQAWNHFVSPPFAYLSCWRDLSSVLGSHTRRKALSSTFTFLLTWPYK